MEQFHFSIKTIILFIGVMIGFVCINYTFPVFPALMRIAFPFNTLILWASFLVIYIAGIRIQGYSSLKGLQFFIPFILFLIAIKVTIPHSILPYPKTNDEGWNLVWQKAGHWGWKAIIPILFYVIWLGGYKTNPTLKISSTKLWLIVGFALIFIPAALYLQHQSAFQASYPKLKAIDSLKESSSYWKYAIGYEVLYLIDFITIEILFRGLLVQVLLKHRNVFAYILPMSLVYGVIHYAKPLVECVSSFFGGALLGYLTYKTNEIYWGILIHLYIALVIELVMIF